METVNVGMASSGGLGVSKKVVMSGSTGIEAGICMEVTIPGNACFGF